MNDGLKQRIIGAVVLLALAVIFVPVIFDKERITPVDRNTQIPIMPLSIAQTDAAKLITKKTEIAQEKLEKATNVKSRKKADVNAASDEDSLSQKKSATVEAGKNNTLAVNESMDSSAVDIKAEKTIRDIVKAPNEIFIPDDKHPENLSSEAPSLDENGVAKAWVLQVASYQNVARAKKIHDELIAKGYMSFTKLIKTSAGETTRVYVGPSLLKDTLIEAKTVIEHEYKISTMLLRFKP